MDQTLKQRLTGAVVIISLAVIFLPLILDGQEPAVEAGSYEPPPQPAISIQRIDGDKVKAHADAVSRHFSAIAAEKKVQAEQAAAGLARAVNDPEANDQQQSGETAAAPSSEAEEAGPPVPAAAAGSVASAPIESAEAYLDGEERQATLRRQQEAAPPVELADSWIVQVGAFSDLANARNLRDKLVAAGYKVYTRKAGEVYRVYVGPEVRRYRLESKVADLEARLGSKVLIMKYIP